ncbi:MAG: GNAT family N-acetyltransferase [Geodermatophilaceae bacterium]|nr:GNAT family N-acetyltransferase [Geodermatophilaceae bacterium]
MQDALWWEIQRRYDFTAPDPIDRSAFDGPRGAFWVASHDGRPIGSIALAPLDHPEVAELDVMYVAPDHRGTGLAQALLATLEDHARGVGIRLVRLRAGEPQPEALRFYVAAGFRPIPPFGRWAGDDTARCFEKALGRVKGGEPGVG